MSWEVKKTETDLSKWRSRNLLCRILLKLQVNGVESQSFTITNSRFVASVANSNIHENIARMWNVESVITLGTCIIASRRQTRNEEQGKQQGAEGDGIHANESTPNGEQRNTEIPTKDQPENMEYEEKVHGLKRQHTTESDSDGKAPSRHARINPAPNLKGRRKGESSTPVVDTSHHDLIVFSHIY